MSPPLDPHLIWTIIKIEEDIMVLNNMTRFHKILIQNIRLIKRTLLQMVNFMNKGP